MNKDQFMKISITAEVKSFDLMWISKLFAIIDESHSIPVDMHGKQIHESEAVRKLKEIKELVNNCQLKSVKQ